MRSDPRVVAACLVCFAGVLGIEAAAVAPQVDGELIAQGNYCFNVTLSPYAATDMTAPRAQRGTCHRYAVMFDLTSHAGWYARVFDEGPFITMIYPDAANPTVLYTVQYNTQYLHWRTRGPNLDNWGFQGEDITWDWRAVKAGKILLDAPAPPGVVNAGALGNWKQTYRSFGGSDEDWEGVQDHYQRIAFDVLATEPTVLTDFEMFLVLRDQSAFGQARILGVDDFPPIAGFPPLFTESMRESELAAFRERVSLETVPAESDPPSDPTRTRRAAGFDWKFSRLEVAAAFRDLFASDTPQITGLRNETSTSEDSRAELYRVQWFPPEHPWVRNLEVFLNYDGTNRPSPAELLATHRELFGGDPTRQDGSRWRKLSENVSFVVDRETTAGGLSGTIEGVYGSARIELRFLSRPGVSDPGPLLALWPSIWERCKQVIDAR